VKIICPLNTEISLDNFAVQDK